MLQNYHKKHMNYQRFFNPIRYLLLVE